MHRRGNHLLTVSIAQAVQQTINRCLLDSTYANKEHTAHTLKGGRARGGGRRRRIDRDSLHSSPVS